MVIATALVSVIWLDDLANRVGPTALALLTNGNEIAQVPHATAQDSTAALVEIIRVARGLYAKSFRTTEAFGVAAVMYGVLTALLVLGFRALERRHLRHLA